MNPKASNRVQTHMSITVIEAWYHFTVLRFIISKFNFIINQHNNTSIL
jgi:hypothetical protein